jgi:hypothetical protein
MRLVRSRKIRVLAVAASFVTALSGTAVAQAETVAPGHIVTATEGSRSISWSTPAMKSRHGQIQNIEKTREAATVITLKNAAAPTKYDFTLHLPQTDRAVLIPDGRVLVAAPDGTILGAFQQPWAKDATGRSLDTKYVLSGSVLSQIIDTSGAVFPVTADPHYTWGWISGTIYFNKAETKLMAVGASVVSWIPTPYTVWGGRTLAALAGIGVATNRCIKWKIWAIGVVAGAPALYSGGYCR